MALKKSFFLWPGLAVAMLFLPLDSVLAADDQCTASYGELGYTCNVKADCNDSDEVKANVKEAFAAKKAGTVEGAVIVGVCADSKQVCCQKTKVAGGASGGSGAPVAGGEDGGTAGCNAVCQWIKANYGVPKNPDGTDYKGPIPDCAFSGQCREVNDVVQILINQGKLMFGLIGTVALVAFVYGGFLMVFSFGSSDKVQQGKDVMIAAVIGIIIVFSAYLLVNFILNAIGVSPEFQAIK